MSFFSHLTDADPSLSAVVTYSAVFACTVLIGVWASVDMARLIRNARGEA